MPTINNFLLHHALRLPHSFSALKFFLSCNIQQRTKPINQPFPSNQPPLLKSSNAPQPHDRHAYQKTTTCVVIYPSVVTTPPPTFITNSTWYVRGVGRAATRQAKSHTSRR
jgi:hypothetical protein